jgi:hypothetical protein
MNAPLPSVVHFRLMDAVYPRPLEILARLFTARSVSGAVLAVTQDGTRQGRFLVIQVPGLSEPVIVPADSCRAVEPPADAGNADEAPG